MDMNEAIAEAKKLIEKKKELQRIQNEKEEQIKKQQASREASFEKAKRKYLWR